MVVAPPPPHLAKGDYPVKDAGWATHPLHYAPLPLQPRRVVRHANPRIRTRKPVDAPIEEREFYVALSIGKDGRVVAQASAALDSCKKQILSTAFIQQFQDAVNLSEAEGRARSIAGPAEADISQERDASFMAIDTNVGTISYAFPRPQKRARANTESGCIPSSIDRGLKSARVQQMMLDGVRKTTSFQIGDTAQAERWIVEAFEAVQQVTCRLIAKLWIKKIEPKKQSAHPYNGGMPKHDPIKDPERTKPPYWPPGIPHKEPDHIPKNQRITLLTHLLMNTPYQQLVPKDKLGDDVGAAQLRAQTAERKVEIPPDKYEILQEIYRVRELMEIFNDGGYDPSMVVNVIDCSKTTRLDQGETEEDIEDDGPAHSDAPNDEAEGTEHAETAMLTPTSSTLPSPAEPKHTQGLNNVSNSVSSSFSNQAGDAGNDRQPFRQQLRSYDDSFEPAMSSEMMDQSATTGMTYNQQGFAQSPYSQLQTSQPQFSQLPLHPLVEHHETTRWGDYNNPDTFGHLSNMSAGPVHAEPVMAEYGMYNGAPIGSMAPTSHGLPCPEDFYRQQARMDQMQRQNHHNNLEIVSQLASQPAREMPYRTTSAQSVQHMAISRHNSYDPAMMQNSSLPFFPHL